MSDWEEIQRLAADFQKVQLTSTNQKLSERNCVEIISWLIDKKLIDLVFTSDGKEYLTPSQLISDIQNELFASGGRVNLTELARIIGVDYGHINAHLNDVLKSRKDIQNILGQLIDSTYITRIAGEINEKLQQQGQINVGDLTILYDLPADFIQHQIIEKNLDTIIFGNQDKNDQKIFFTKAFIARSKAKLRGALVGLIRPTPVVSILNQIGLNEKLFFSIFDQTSMYGILTSRLTGAQYIPNYYARSQNEWVTTFYKQNNYLEFDALARIGISDTKNYVKKQLANENILFLDTCVAAKSIFERVEADIDECIASKSYVDLQNVLPSVFSTTDRSIIINKLLTSQKQQQVVVVDDLIISKGFANNLIKLCDEKLKENAKEVVENGKYQQYIVDIQGIQGRSQKYEEFDEKSDKRDERRKKAAGGKSGGGTQGRETKTKSTKKHTRGAGNKMENTDDDSTTESVKKELNIISEDEIKELISAILEEEGLDNIMDPIVQYLLPKLNEQGLQIAADIFKTKVADQTANRRKTHMELQDKLNELLSEIRLFGKGIKLLPAADLQSQLNKYLLKTICSDVVTELLNYIAVECGNNMQTDNFNNDQRMKFLNELPSEFRAPLQNLIKTISGQSVEDFMSAIEAALATCSVILKKVDKKKDRTLVLNYKHKLLEEISSCEDVALVLHLAMLIIFISSTQCMLHASGKHVSAILSFLKRFMADEEYFEFMSYYDFVTLMLSNGTEVENAKEKLKEKMPVIKSITCEFKPATSEKSS